MSDLPTGWVAAKLADVISGFQTGRNIQAAGAPARPGQYGVLKISAVTWGRFQPTENKALLPGDQPLPHETVKAGDLLISRANTTALVGAPVLVPDDHPCLMLPDKILRVLYRPEAVDARYLLQALRSERARAHMEAEATGTSDSMRNLSQPKLRDTPIVLPPLRTQKRIADKLDVLLARVDACRARLDGVPALIKRFRQSVLEAATSGALTGPDPLRPMQEVRSGDDVGDVPVSWKVTCLKDVIDPQRPLCYGVVQPGEDDPNGVPLIRVQDMGRSTVLARGLRTISAAVDEEYRRARVQPGDVLVSVVGTIGRTAVVPEGMEANIARAIARVACKPSVNSGWVSIWLASPKVQWWLLNSSREVARKTLNLSDLATIPVALPPPDEQAEIVRRVQTMFTIVDAIEARHQTACAQVDRLTPALLNKAFRGELVSQNANEEPADVLLAGVRSAASGGEGGDA